MRSVKKAAVTGEVKSSPSFTLTDDTKKLFAAIDKETSKNTVTCAADMKAADYGRLRTGILTLDLCLNGGLRKSRGCMLFGESSSGKSTVSLIAIARCLEDNPDKIAVWVDVEGTMETDWAERLGVDLTRFFVVTPEAGEEAVDMYLAFLENPQVCIVVMDSIAMLTPTKEILASAGDALMGVHARLIGHFLRKATVATLKQRKRGYYPIALFINQYRTNLGQMMGDPRILPGGKALKYAVSQGIEIKCKEIRAGAKDASGVKVESDENAGTVLYNEHTFIVAKDKTGGLIKEGKFKLIRNDATGYAPGYIEQTKSIINYAKAIDLHSGAGAHNKLGDYVSYGKTEELQQIFYEDRALQRKVCDHIVDHYVNKWSARA